MSIELPDSKLNPLKKREKNREYLLRESRRKQVAANILAGMTYREIADAMNISAATVTRDFKAILDDWREHYTRDVDDHIKIMARRLDQMYNALYPKIAAGDVGAVLAGCQIIDRLLKLYGINPDNIGIVVNNEIHLEWDDRKQDE